MKALILNPTMPPRAVRIFNQLHDISKNSFTVFFYSISAKNRRWAKSDNIHFPYLVLKTIDLGWQTSDFISLPISLDLVQKLIAYNPDAIIVPGWSDFPSILSALYAKLRGKKLVLRSESTEYEKSWRRTIFSPITYLMIKLATGYIAAGSRAKDYLIHLGADPRKILVAYSTIDIEYFRDEVKKVAKKKAVLKKQLGIKTGSFVFMFNGQMIDRKGVRELIQAFSQLSEDTTLLMVGYGPLEGELKDLIKKLKCQDRVVFTGFIPNHHLPNYYGVSDIFILPSKEETWGMVVNEAMASQLPVIVTKVVGSGEDLVIPRKTGLIIDNPKPELIFEAMDYCVKHPQHVSQMGRQASKHVEKFKLENIARALDASIQL